MHLLQLQQVHPAHERGREAGDAAAGHGAGEDEGVSRHRVGELALPLRDRARPVSVLRRRHAEPHGAGDSQGNFSIHDVAVSCSL